MHIVSTVWNWIQNELLGMQWLRQLTGSLLRVLGLDIDAPVGASVHFFLYDTVKILLLLAALIFAISYIQSYFPPSRSRRILGRSRGLAANAVAALLGTVTPFCSCSSIPLFIGFTSAGLPLGVTFSFLISSPMVDLGSLMLLTGIFGWRVAALYVLLGLLIAITGGALIERLHMEDQIEDFLRGASMRQEDEAALRPSERARFAAAQVGSTVKKVLPYLLVGVGIGAIIHNWIPQDWIILFLGADNPFGVVLATLVGVPVYADIFGTIPIAEALLAKGAQLGVVLAFMMGVTTLSLPSLILLRKAVRPRLLALFVAVCVTGIILVGYVFNAVQPLLF